MAKEESNKKSNTVEVIIEPMNETVDLVGFVRGVLDYEMVKMFTLACFVVLEKNQVKSEGLNKSK